jgi:hypothetical protein
MEDNTFAQLNPVAPMRSLSGKSFFKNTLIPALVVLVIIVIILGGIGTGWFLSKNVSAKKAVVGNDVSSVDKAPGAEVTGDGKEVGVDDNKTFRDNAEGMLVEGGIEGEGTHHLERPGGASQNVYLTSSVVDLDQFVGKKVQVWGETISGKKAGWMMDVGKVKIVE